MPDVLEGTPEFNRGHQLATGEHPIVTCTHNRIDLNDFCEICGKFLPMNLELKTPVVALDSEYDMFADESPIVATCDTENPEKCEVCD